MITSIRFLRNQLEELDPESEEAKSIYSTLIKLRSETVSPKSETENPHAFLSALREIKTGTDGETYKSNYKVLELGKKGWSQSVQ